MKRYRVTALMTVKLETTVEAANQYEAWGKGQAEAELGNMAEVKWSGEIHGWEAEEVP